MAKKENFQSLTIYTLFLLLTLILAIVVYISENTETDKLKSFLAEKYNFTEEEKYDFYACNRDGFDIWWNCIENCKVNPIKTSDMHNEERCNAWCHGVLNRTREYCRQFETRGVNVNNFYCHTTQVKERNVTFSCQSAKDVQETRELMK